MIFFENPNICNTNIGRAANSRPFKFQFDEQHRRECIHAFRKEVLQVTDKSVPYGVE